MQERNHVLFMILLTVFFGACLIAPLSAASLTADQDGVPPDLHRQNPGPADNPDKSLDVQENEIWLRYTAGALWQGTNAACGYGDYLYSYDYPGLQVIDIANPDAPQIVSRYYLPIDAHDIIYDDGFVYVAGGYDGGLLIFDVTDPSSPVLASTILGYGNLTFDGWNVEIINDTLYMGAGKDIVIVDVADPYSPEVLCIFGSAGSAVGLAIRDQYVYTASQAFVEAWDISSLSSPVYLGTADCGKKPRDIAVSDDLLYVASYEDGLYILDVSAGLPSQIGRWQDTTQGWDRVEIVGDYVYLQSTGEIKIIDVRTTSAPTPVGGWTTNGTTWDMYFSENKAYITDWYEGVARYDLSAPVSPALEAMYDSPGMGRELAVSGDIAYVTSDRKGFRVLDLSNPELPEAIASYDTPGMAYAVASAGNAVYLSDDAAGLMVFDVSDPHAPSHVEDLTIPNVATDIAVSGTYAYVACGDTLTVFDINEPLSPVQVAGVYVTPTVNVEVQGDYAYISSHDVGLQVLDISDPTAPAIIGTCPLDGQSLGLIPNGDYVYIFHGFNGDMSIIDVSNPANPTVAADLPDILTGTAIPYQLQVVGEYLYVAATPAALRVLNISDPLVPYPAGSFITHPIYPMDVDVAGDYIYLTGDNGFLVLRQADCNGPDGASGFNIADAVYLIHYIFAGGPEPDPLEVGDVNCDGAVNLGDAVYIIDFIFRDGPPPCGGCY